MEKKKKVKIRDDFWSPCITLVKNTVLPYQWDILNDRVEGVTPSHAVKNFKIAAGLEEGEFYGEVFQDSDLAKWMEAVSFLLQEEPNEQIETLMDEIIDLIEKAQQEDGYLDTYFVGTRKKQRWSNLYECHEMYCAGHLMEAAVAYYYATGKRKFLALMCRCADHIQTVFGNAEGKKAGYPGHQEIELALIKLYDATGEKKYLELSKYFLEERGREPNYFVNEWETKREKRTFKNGNFTERPNLVYNQSHMPVKQQREAVGHAVRAMYMYSAMADMAYETKDAEWREASEILWNNVTNRQMYITGAIGSTHTGEAFTFDYDLPNETAYAETCASVGLVFWAHRMQRLEMRASYADVIEKVLYNVILASMSQDGKHFFYVNPLDVWPEATNKNPERAHVKASRRKWFGCACCPPNIARLLTSLSNYIYTFEKNTAYIHLYIGSEVCCEVENGCFSIKQSGNYPSDGNLEFLVRDIPDAESTLAFRIPGWCRQWKMEKNDELVFPEVLNGYAYLKGRVHKGDVIRLILTMDTELIQANPQVRADAGKVAIMRGPLVYCIEEEDNGRNLSALRLDEHTAFIQEFSCDVSDRVPVLLGNGFRRVEQWNEELYRPYQRQEEKVLIKAIPYFLWGNRSCGEMMVWMRI